MLSIRPARIEDLNTITAIYNDAILSTTATFDTNPKTNEEQMEWFSAHNSRYPILVAEYEDSVVGWASLTPWSDRCAYSATAECSLYVEGQYRNRGIGKRLLTELLQAARKAGLHTVIARITEGNDVGIRLCKSLGLRRIGIMREVGQKFGKLLDVQLMQVVFAASDSQR